MNAIAIEYQNTADLIPYARNSRTHSDEQVAQIAASIREFGFTNPVLIDAENGIIAGHGRILGAGKLGIEQVPCIRLGYLTDAQKRAYVIADNKLALNAGWDEEMLRMEIADLQELDFDLDLLGFSDEELAEFMDDEPEQKSGLTDQDAAPEPPAVPVANLGDVWVLGNHRVMCGDSTSKSDVERLMAGEVADLVFTSPPYGNQRDYTTGGIGDWDLLMQGVFSSAPVSDAAQILVNLGLIHYENEWVPYWDSFISYMRGSGYRRYGLYVWDQMHGLRGDFHGRFSPSFELIFHFNKIAKKPNKFIECIHYGEKGGGLRKKDGSIDEFASDEIQRFKILDSVWRVQRQKGGIEGHPAPFSVSLVENAINSFDGYIYEPFCGSGTTVIAAEKHNRKCFGMEIAPQYCDVIVSRWQDYTGKTAVLESTGQTFNELASNVR